MLSPGQPTEGEDEGRVIIVGNELTFSQGDYTKDFENPQSDDGDNLYEFILVVSDGNLDGGQLLHCHHQRQ